MIQVKVSQAITTIAAAIKVKLVPFLTGSPGIGKSHIAFQIAKTYNLKVIDLRLSQCDPTDLLGFPTITGNRAGYVPMDTFPIEGDKLPINPLTGEAYAGWLLFLDEFNSASTAVQAAAYKIVLDRMVGIHHLHKNVAIMCAGNLETDNAIVNPMSTALQSRLVHLQLVIDVKEWVDWAFENKIDHRITDYVQFKPGNIYTFSPNHTDCTYASPRTWEFLNRLLGSMPPGSHEELALYAGAVSEGVAREFITYCKIYDDLPKMHIIEATPDTVKMPDEPSILYALSGSLSHNATIKNFSQFMKFITRMPVEFQVVTLRETVRRNKSMMGHASVQKWVAESAAALF